MPVSDYMEKAVVWNFFQHIVIIFNERHHYKKKKKQCRGDSLSSRVTGVSVIAYTARLDMFA